jgi:hypothetical protein
MPHSLSAPTILQTTLLAAVLAAPLLGCTQSQENGMTGSSVPPGSAAAAAPGDVVGGGGALDQTYREIYTPGDPRWSNEY